MRKILGCDQVKYILNKKYPLKIGGTNSNNYKKENICPYKKGV
jgi:hypothetical protein